MASYSTTPAASALRPTRLQIDELDALLKNMLTLPPAPEEPEGPTAAETAADKLPVPESSYRVTTGEFKFSPKDVPATVPQLAEIPNPQVDLERRPPLQEAASPVPASP